MEMTHITAFTDAMKRKNLEGMLIHMADNVVLNTPLASETGLLGCYLRPGPNNSSERNRAAASGPVCNA